MILCIETSGKFCSVGLSHRRELLSISESDSPNDHSSMIMYHVDHCLTQAGTHLRDVEAVAVSMGPGSFTGLRVGLSAAKGICFGLEIPLIEVSTLASLASAAFLRSSGETEYCFAMIEARLMEVYCGVFDRDGRSIIPDQVVELHPDWDREITSSNAIIFCGNGVDKYLKLNHSTDKNKVQTSLSAANLIRIASQKHIKKDYCVANSAKPYYLKKPHITQARKVL